MTTLAAQLASHGSMQPIELLDMYAAHPAKVGSNGKRFTPAVHRGPRGDSIFMYPGSEYAYNNKMLPDGCTIEYRPSTHPEINAGLDDTVGREVILYAQLRGKQCRQGRVRVSRAGDVYHLRLVPGPAAPPAAEPKKKAMWADME